MRFYASRFTVIYLIGRVNYVFFCQTDGYSKWSILLRVCQYCPNFRTFRAYNIQQLTHNGCDHMLKWGSFLHILVILTSSYKTWHNNDVFLLDDELSSLSLAKSSMVEPVCELIFSQLENGFLIHPGSKSGLDPKYFAQWFMDGVWNLVYAVGGFLRSPFLTPGLTRGNRLVTFRF